MDKKDEIKKILSPHFGYLKLYLKWSETCSIKKIEEFNNIIKDNKDIVKKLPKQLTSYKTYDSAFFDVYNIQKNIKIQRTFKDGLNSTSRKFFESTFKKYLPLYQELLNNEFKTKMFFRNSSKPKTESEYISYLRRVVRFDDSMKSLIERIESKFDYLRIKSGGYLFRLEPSMLDMVPAIWCIYNSEPTYYSEIRDRELNSIWLVVDPYHYNIDRRIVGIDVDKNRSGLLYMNSLNNRFTDNPPIETEEFFKITRTRLREETSSGIDPDNPPKDFTDIMNTIMEVQDQYYNNTYSDITRHDVENKEQELYEVIRRMFER